MGQRTRLFVENQLKYAVRLPPIEAVCDYIHSLGKPDCAQLLNKAKQGGEPLIQPRCGVGSHQKMSELLKTLSEEANPEILTLTIDAYTRLNKFIEAGAVLGHSPDSLNGYPLVAHGWSRVRQLNEAMSQPLQVRHGSPMPNLLFDYSVVAGITSFEGGGITYNLPYCKSVSLADSIGAWQYVDECCGELFERGVVIEREVFGTLSAVLMPPSISIAISILEAALMYRAGARCISIAYPQSGNLVQDVAAMQVLPQLFDRYVGKGCEQVQFNVVLHQFMGPFPADKSLASALIFLGGAIGIWGKAQKIIYKTTKEAVQIPSVQDNIEGAHLTRKGIELGKKYNPLDNSAIALEKAAIAEEVKQILSVIDFSRGLERQIIEAFARGELDIPFCTSTEAHSKVRCMRNEQGAIRIVEGNNMALSDEILKRNRDEIGYRQSDPALVNKVTRDIMYFSQMTDVQELLNDRFIYDSYLSCM